MNELQAGQTSLIFSVKTKTPENSQMLTAMGIIPDATVRMINNFTHHVVFKVDQKKFAADKEMAARIFVRTAG